MMGRRRRGRRWRWATVSVVARETLEPLVELGRSGRGHGGGCRMLLIVVTREGSQTGDEAFMQHREPP